MFPQLDDVMVNFDSTRGQILNLEKKQKKFDAQLAEQQALSEKNAAERDAAEARARQAETKSLSLSTQLEELQDKLDEVERLKKQLQVRRSTLYIYILYYWYIQCNFIHIFVQAERDSLVESKDDAGKNVHELAKAKKTLEQMLEEQKLLLEETEDELQVVEDAKLRLEVRRWH